MNPDDYQNDDDEETARQKLMRVDDYTELEIQEDINMVDWDFAYNEILKLEERKKSKYTSEANAQLEVEKARIE